MSAVLVVAEIGIAPGRREEALAAFRALSEETHAKDEGCLLYAVQLDPEDESHVFMIEKWTSPESLQAHFATDHVKAFRESGVLSGNSTVTKMEQANFGDPSKGTI